MIPAIRQQYNADFTEEKYLAFVQNVKDSFPDTLEFRMSETPVFVPHDLRDKLISAGEHIIDVIVQPDFMEKTERAIPADQRVPNETRHCSLVTFDFAVCKDETGALSPQLIDMQGFANLYC